MKKILLLLTIMGLFALNTQAQFHKIYTGLAIDLTAGKHRPPGLILGTNLRKFFAEAQVSYNWAKLEIGAIPHEHVMISAGTRLNWEEKPAPSVYAAVTGYLPMVWFRPFLSIGVEKRISQGPPQFYFSVGCKLGLNKWKKSSKSMDKG